MGLFGTTAFIPIPEAGVWAHVQTQVLGSPATTVTFSGLVGDDFYQVSAYLIKDSGAQLPALLFRLNNDSAANYSMARISNSDAVRTGSSVAAQTSMATATTLGANGLTGLTAVIAKVAAAQRAQMWAIYAMDITGLTLVSERAFGEWNNTAATINRIDILIGGGAFAAGTSVRLDRKSAA